jgi:hypothetical protein
VALTEREKQILRLNNAFRINLANTLLNKEDGIGLLQSLHLNLGEKLKIALN